MSEVYREEDLCFLMPLYYARLFPIKHICQWLTQGDSAAFPYREISFTLIGDIYIRFQSFETPKEFATELAKHFPIKIDIGCQYTTKPKEKNSLGTNMLKPALKEMVFDIDMTDYDEVRTCCSGADVCNKCWKFMTIACKIIDAALREDFHLQHILWVFSGRRGIHCWVSDVHSRYFDNPIRSSVAEYLHLIKSGLKQKKIFLPGTINTAVKRALRIIDKYFVNFIVKDQDILGTEERLKYFLSLIDEKIRDAFWDNMRILSTSLDRWKEFETTFDELQQKNQIPWNLKNLKEEIKLHYCYPRLDINVTKGINHLLKAPFCVHPKTGKVCVPFTVKHADNFDPENVPTINGIISEIDAYDKKSMELGRVEDTSIMEVDSTQNIRKRRKIKDYKKTSLLKHVNIFTEFLRDLNKQNFKEMKFHNNDTTF